MATFLYKTKGNADPKGKPRVYFTCHPEDFERYFTKIWEDISATHDVALYYTEDMAEDLDREHMETDLGQMNLFVVPVTWRLLSQPNRAMDADISYAKQENIPILPFMMEQGIDEFYSKPEKFGQRQYLAPYTSDLTAIRYEEKLKKYLESVLISDELAQRVRAAFDAYIFLSYRKKDRKYANELMKLIHKNPECRDIAIWYDEFLTPGESFAENIPKALENSKLFALLVTPNLLEEPDGKPNFVMAEEYPAAAKAEKTVLPAEMVKTDHAALASKFPSIPDCADPQDEAAFKERLLHSLQKIAISANNDDPEHNFLIGLAYLDGIDVEVNRQRGIELLTSAAEKNLPEAMQKLLALYYNDFCGSYGYPKAVKWAERLYIYSARKYGKEHLNTLKAVHSMAHAYRKNQEFGKAAELREYLYKLTVEQFGEEHSVALDELHSLSTAYVDDKQLQKALTAAKKEFTLREKLQGSEHQNTIQSMRNLASIYSLLERHEDAAVLYEKVFSLQCSIIGEEHWETRRSLCNLADEYDKMQYYEKARDLYERAYAIENKISEEDKRFDVHILFALSRVYKRLGNRERYVGLGRKALALQGFAGGFTLSKEATEIKNLYALSLACEQLGEQETAIQKRNKAFLLLDELGECHPQAIEAVYLMGRIHKDRAELEKAGEMTDRALERLRKALAEERTDAMAAAKQFADACKFDDPKRATELYEIAYNMQRKVLGEKNPETHSTLIHLAWVCRKSGNYQQEREAYEKLYALESPALLDERDEAVWNLEYFAEACRKCGDYRREIEIRQRIYTSTKMLSGENHPRTLVALKKLACGYSSLGDMDRFRTCREQIVDALAVKFPSISDYSDSQDGTSFKERLMKETPKITVAANNDDPEHNFLIGLTYLKGIDVEEDRQRGVELITSAAEAGLPEAMKKLRDIYAFDLPEAQKWTMRLAEYYVQQRSYGDPVTLDALFMAARACDLCGKRGQAAMLYGKVLYFREKLLGSNHPDTLTALHEVAVHTEWDEKKKCRRLQEVYDLRCQVMGDSHLDTLTSLECLAASCDKLGDYKAALKYYHKSSSNVGKAATSEAIANLYGKLGDAEREQRWRESAAVVQRTEVMFQSIENAEQMVAFRNFLLDGLYDEESCEDTVSSIQSVINVIEECVNAESDLALKLELGQFFFGCFLGEEYPETQAFYSNAADVYKEREEYIMELSLREKIYAQKQQAGEESSDTLAALERLYTLICQIERDKLYNHIATIESVISAYEKRKENNKVLKLYELLHAIRVDTLGEEHDDTLKTLGKLSSWYSVVSNFQTAIDTRERLIALKVKRYGEESDRIAFDVLMLAAYYGEIKNYNKKIDLLERRQGILRKECNGTTPASLFNMRVLQNAYLNAGKYEKALKWGAEVFSLHCSALGAEHKDTLEVLHTLAYTYAELGNHEKSAELCEQAYVAKCRVLGEKHKSTLVTLDNLAYSYGELGHYEKERELFEKVYTLRCRVLGEEHPDTLASLGNLGHTYGKLGQHEKAVELREKVYILRCKVQGEDHPDTLRAKESLAAARKKLEETT